MTAGPSLVRVVSGRYAGMTVSDVAAQVRRSAKVVLLQLEAGIDPELAKGGRREGADVTAWREKYLPAEIRGLSWVELRKHFHVGVAELQRWIQEDLPPRTGKSRGAARERNRAWRDRYLPDELRSASITAIAAYYRVSRATLDNWAKRDVPPGVTNRRHGAVAKEWRFRWLAPRLRDARTKDIAAHYQASISTVKGWIRDNRAPVMGGRRRRLVQLPTPLDTRAVPLIAELYARKPVTNRLTRIFRAEMHVGGG